ncbi:hypothetical protein [Nostoc sp. PCC 9305]|uniref:hypothetical protein n=1 Tax=Nostoc sp. PCC 9305 TaxID=296636 RepID=UPI0039C5EFC1
MSLSSAYFQLAIALWNGEDSILKERIFSLTGSEVNHGEDVKLIQQFCEYEAQYQEPEIEKDKDAIALT